jgi:hypothetical protein
MLLQWQDELEQQHPLRIATDAARKRDSTCKPIVGIFSIDVPCNPGRMEQRNGRIDRKLQPNADVYCHFFYTQRPEDRILKVLVEKTKRIQKELGSLSQVIESRLERLMKNGIRRRDLSTLEQQIRDADIEKERRETMQDELEAARKRQDTVRGQVDRLRGMLNRSRQAVAFQEDHFRAAISWTSYCGFRATWRPDRRCQGPDAVYVSSDRPAPWSRSHVGCHSRRLAQAVVHHDLSHACLSQTNDAIRRVILLGRLAFYGPGQPAFTKRSSP